MGLRADRPLAPAGAGLPSSPPPALTRMPPVASHGFQASEIRRWRCCADVVWVQRLTALGLRHEAKQEAQLTVVHLRSAAGGRRQDEQGLEQGQATRAYENGQRTERSGPREVVGSKPGRMDEVGRMSCGQGL